VRGRAADTEASCEPPAEYSSGLLQRCVAVPHRDGEPLSVTPNAAPPLPLVPGRSMPTPPSNAAGEGLPSSPGRFVTVNVGRGATTDGSASPLPGVGDE
jgi:hypothetical protein